MNVLIYGRKRALTYYSAVRRVTVIVSILKSRKQATREEGSW